MSSKIPVAISFTGVANLLGVVGVIGCLVFGGLELQQSHQIALGGQQQARTALIAELWLAGLQGESETLTAMQSQWETLTPHQKSVREQMQRFFLLSHCFLGKIVASRKQFVDFAKRRNSF